jgi:multicomponent Na+:H+ antiporter subunit G
VSAGDVVVYVLLAAGVVLEVLACAGVVAMRTVYARLHYVAPSCLGAALIAAAVCVREGPSYIGIKAVLLAAFLLVTSPALAHVTARAALINERGDWRPDDAVEAEER